MDTAICLLFFLNIYTCFDYSFSLLCDEKCTFFFFKYRPLVDNEHVGKIRSPGGWSKTVLILCIMFIGDKVVSCPFQVFYCDHKESRNVIRCTEYNSMLSKQPILLLFHTCQPDRS